MEICNTQKGILKNTNNKIMFFMILLSMWSLMAFSTNNADYAYYSLVFERIENGVSYYAVETGFYILCKISVKLGIGYPVFLTIYSGIAFLLITNSIVKYTNKPIAVLFMYFCYPFILDIAQIRHFMACAIFIFSARYLKEYSIKNVVKYCILIILAVSQQIFSLVFFLFLLVYISDKKKVVLISIITTFFLFFGERALLNSSLYRAILSLRNSDINYTKGIPIAQFVKYAFFFSVLLLLCLFFNSKKLKKYDFIFKICMLSWIYIPLILIDFQYTRFFRSSIIYIYIYIINGIDSLKSIKERLLFRIGIAIVMLSVFIILFGPTSGYFETMTIPIFTENAFWNFII